VGGVDFQACSIDHSDISPFRINDLRAVRNSVAQNPPSGTSDLACRMMPTGYGHAHDVVAANCVRPLNVLRSLTAILLSRASARFHPRCFASNASSSAPRAVQSGQVLQGQRRAGSQRDTVPEDNNLKILRRGRPQPQEEHL